MTSYLNGDASFNPWSAELFLYRPWRTKVFSIWNHHDSVPDIRNLTVRCRTHWMYFTVTAGEYFTSGWGRNIFVNLQLEYRGGWERSSKNDTLKTHTQAKIIKKSVILFLLLNMTIWCKHVHRLKLHFFFLILCCAFTS